MRKSRRKRTVHNYSELNDIAEYKETRAAKKFLEILKEKKFSRANVVRKLSPDECNVSFIEREGLRYPIMVDDHSDLGMIMPSSFTVNDVRDLVGNRIFNEISSKFLRNTI